jgi:aspartate beta-hydroxylase
MTTEPHANPHISRLTTSARALAQQGKPAEAAALYERILAAAPDHLEALGYLAGRAFEAQDSARSAALLERAAELAPEQPILHQNLGVVRRARGEFAAAIERFDRVIALAPNYALAHLQKGRALEENNRPQEAVASYVRAWNLAPEFDRALQATETPQSLRELLQAAAHTIREARRERIDRALEPLWDTLDETLRSRLAQTTRVYLGEAEPSYQHALQRPSFLYYPGIAPRMFFKREELSWIAELEAHTDDIREELLAVLKTPDTLDPYVQFDNAGGSQWETLNHSPAWSSFHLYKGGERVAEHCARCPRTAAIVEQLPLAQCPGHAPEALFSVLKPGTHIPPHVGLGNYKSVVHLPLIIPPDCAIRVGTETRQWSEGECLIFDDSFEHEAWNRSNAVRTVLILDAWNPSLSEIEQRAMATLIGGIDRFYRDFR